MNRKASASTIETDAEFEIALSAILKKRSCSLVSVFFNQEDLNGFHIRLKRVRNSP